MKKLKENVTMSFVSTIIAAINVILSIINVFIGSVFLRGFIWGILFTTITLSLVRLGILEYNFKVDRRKYNKRFGFREDFNPLKRWHLVTYVKGYRVSTVDLGIDHNLLGGKPLYYKTMIFDTKDEEHRWSEIYLNRYSTKEEAKKGHKQVIKYVKEKLKEEQ